MIFDALKNPMITTSLVVAFSLLYVYFVYRDLQSHNRHIFELQQRVDALYKVVLTRPPFTAEAATQVEEEDEDEELVSVASEELRSMLDIISDPPEPQQQQEQEQEQQELQPTLAELRAFLKAHNVNARGSRDALLARAAEIKSKLDAGASNDVADAEAL
jgi:hypothetical protein